MRLERFATRACLLVLTGSALACIASGCTSARARGASDTFEFGVVGDGPYVLASEAPFERVIADMNRSELAFVVHVGDIQADPRIPFAGGIPTCTDASLQRRKELFDASQHPFILVPGDNEWTDCHLLQDRVVDPLERLERLRSVFFASDYSLGQVRLTLASQAHDDMHPKYVENRQWIHGGVLFVTLHIVGSNNNLGRTPQMDDEYAQRNAANLEWLKKAFLRARWEQARAVVILMQANPKFETSWSATQVGRYLPGLPVTVPEQRIATGFDDFRDALERELISFSQPVLLIHGDTHIFRVDKPLKHADDRVIEHFTRLETFGHPDVHWVRVSIDPARSGLFAFTPETGAVQ